MILSRSFSIKGNLGRIAKRPFGKATPPSFRIFSLASRLWKGRDSAFRHACSSVETRAWRELNCISWRVAKQVRDEIGPR